MSKGTAAILVSPMTAVAKAPVWLRRSGIVLAGSAFAALCAHLSLPLFFTPVPLSLAPFAVLVLGLVLSPRMAAATFAAYLAEGAAGLPVFSPSPVSGGLAHLFGPTGGYLLAYPLAAALISFLFRRVGRGYISAFACAAAGDLLILTCGALWLAAFTHIAVMQATALAVLPFLAGDALKIAAAAAVASGAARLRPRTA
ncbi:MAG: biotin transporter BioY [Terracidiphilus sp.]|jgi:biotin transport system substrate-specific component